MQVLVDVAHVIDVGEGMMNHGEVQRHRGDEEDKTDGQYLFACRKKLAQKCEAALFLHVGGRDPHRTDSNGIHLGPESVDYMRREFRNL